MVSLQDPDSALIITANSCLNHRKRRRREPQTARGFDHPETALSDGTSNPQSLLERKELRLFLENAIQALPQDQRLVLVLRDIEGLSYEEIAGSLGLELGTVRSRLHRARSALRAAIRPIVSLNGEGDRAS